ncbi:adenylyl-sulfate kinase [Pseudoalteromonas luteoviolacea]|uniref:Adenylyl-sulfate kinase n=1 Tax=Pseudoalteromonas luteoviolacea S4054 TaxID=1129367 RepID=A0A0F6AGA7_9GAMM|nr:adenylyl-sulfate kinase [Pseudoalteromonas luteoviolacea]AOT09894.1 adenylyl-sulfate kinase [Pseudoalteromonas luteoviolacea]AOT14805.1 adenylyl-sulfate kinase [Pseudoalteromonas luteoviolacea]AOT19721.1 adenylyl-sulfate kinase [Pseudoalteromonas luteoviolacea]KKE85255.1 adenylylsulfate kinase [Pseudoalteromonas luteoviolacea S4054]KZN64025.1 adenylylsulfate kinase [Pseudoalteromonas luteoviolacea S4047-1]
MDKNIVWHNYAVEKTHRSELKGHKPVILWFTGFSGSGKSTVANALESALHQNGVHTYLLDGDNVRHGLCKDLGFSDADRVENIRRVGELSKLMVDAGLIVLTAFISPFQAERDMVRNLVEDGEFVEVFLDTPLEICEQRDPKGLYKKARAGEIKNFTGIDSDYQPPVAPEIRLNTGENSLEQSVQQLIDYLKDKNIIQ